ncbi:tripartite tricarboxylate transporter substrate binding protein [Cupriavidus sp. CV2]|uniref:Bug family tripartite tricarboxylate transporter substrate binding protein n=1 Tax=Cupriavidus ulmosensis TaxID=3065913 RepID=UPI00296AEACB|nr:tripartite tricarboxylate transporter substrate binding protein [Cupriavidus sp. CV2]MDW3681369.1 tripartite tricarboxylate transporter substrate binding protein [Cupriavidus sp. CV2]
MTPSPKSASRRRCLALCLGAAVVLAAGTAQADPWPTRPVTMIVPFAAGGSTDVLGRVIGQKLSEMWKQTVVVENRLGAGGAVGAQVTAKAAADGYTMMLASGSMFTVNPFIYQRLPYSAKDFTFITNVASGPMLVVVSPGVSARTLKELISLAKSQPGKLNFGSAGTGSQVHMAGEAFADAAGIDIAHVPYKGESLAYNDLMAGQLQLMVGNIAAASQFVKGGKLRALAVTGTERSPMLPDVPTVAEAGLTGMEGVTGWFGFVMPAGTPPAIVSKVQQDTVRVLADPDTQARLLAQGMKPVGNTPQQLSAAIATESVRWEKIVKNRNLTAN